MNNPQPFTTVHALQLGYELALRNLDPCIEALIDALDAATAQPSNASANAY